MHDRTRRFICRLSFMLLCVLPTLSVASAVAILRSSAYLAAEKAAWEQRLADDLGLIATLHRVTHPLRGITLLEGLELADPETALRVLQVRRVEIGRRNEELVLLASQPELQGEQAWRLWEILHERLLRGRDASQRRVQLWAGEVTVHRGGQRGASTLTDVRCRLAPTAEGPQLVIEFREVALQMAEPVQLRVTRNRRLSPAATRWELQTRSTALPCALLADQVEILDRLGDRVTFQGSVEVTQTAGGWEGTLRGRFRDVDLDRLVTDHYDHKLSGLAEIGFQRATFRGSKLIDASGEVACPGGQVSWSLLDQAAKALGLSADARVQAVAADVQWRYQELRFGFTLDSHGLAIVGQCAAAGEGVVMTDRQGPLLIDKPQEVALVGLIRALCSKNGEAVPATAEASQLLHVLPIPSGSATPAGSQVRRPYSPLRLR